MSSNSFIIDASSSSLLFILSSTPKRERLGVDVASSFELTGFPMLLLVLELITFANAALRGVAALDGVLLRPALVKDSGSSISGAMESMPLRRGESY